MKKAIISPVIFLIICILVIQFLHLFAEAKSEITYLNFSESVQILEDGTEIPFSTEAYSNEEGISGTYRFTGKIPNGIGNGSLVFEISSMDCFLYLNGTKIYSSSSSDSEVIRMGQINIPLAENTAAVQDRSGVL